MVTGKDDQEPELIKVSTVSRSVYRLAVSNGQAGEVTSEEAEMVRRGLRDPASWEGKHWYAYQGDGGAELTAVNVIPD